jgi:hypothetical protein
MVSNSSIDASEESSQNNPRILRPPHQKSHEEDKKDQKWNEFYVIGLVQILSRYDQVLVEFFVFLILKRFETNSTVYLTKSDGTSNTKRKTF